METEPPRSQRRALLAALGSSLCWPGVPAAAALGSATNSVTAALAPARPSRATSTTLAAAWERAGQFSIGLVSAPSAPGAPLQALAQHEVPTRAHALLPQADGSVIAVARRPGDWLLRWHADGRAAPQWHWIEEARAFCGHVLASADGCRLFTTEINLETGESLVGVRDARSLLKQAEWPTQGRDAHELVWDPRVTTPDAQGRPQPSLLVANGGVPTAPETGRAKRDLQRMDSSLVRLDGNTGQVLGQWRLADRRLSLRHLAWSADGGTLGIALQAEHDHVEHKQRSPVLALFDGHALRTFPAPAGIAQAARGYGGSMAATSGGWAVSCPRAHGVALYAPDGQWMALVPLDTAYALAPQQGRLWVAGLRASLQDAQTNSPRSHPHGGDLSGVRFDNHWAAFPV